MKYAIGILLFLSGMLLLAIGRCSAAGAVPFKPGEKLHYSVYLGDFPAGDIRLAVQPMTILGSTPAYHFVMASDLSPILNELLQLADRIESYTDRDMAHALLYKEFAGGSSQPASTVTFDWAKRQARCVQGGQNYKPTALLPGAFDPLSILYALRLLDLAAARDISKPVSNGLRCGMARATVRGRQRVRLENGQHYTAYLVEAPLTGFSDMFKDNSSSVSLKLWISADARRLPVKMDFDFPVGACRIELKNMR